jgi:hypothetical protein
MGLGVGISAISASDMPIPRAGTGGRLPGCLEFPQFPQAIGQWPVAWRGTRGRVQRHGAMALREIIEASEHDADPA